MISENDVVPLLTWLPRLEAADLNAGEWRGGSELKPGVIQMPWFDLSSEAARRCTTRWDANREEPDPRRAPRRKVVTRDPNSARRDNRLVYELPAGKVTFLFTDVEGSTRLLDELGADRYADALAEHRRELRAAFARHGGVEVDTQGDAFFVAFRDAAAAVSAADEGRSALAHGPIRVRMGVHTGEPLLTSEGYVGIDVHRGARIAAAGHGGQVIVSETTYAALGDGVALRDLGEQRLKDLGAPIRLFQLGDEDFPPLKVLYRSTLPVQPSPLVGRGRELREAASLLSDHRLVTFTGPGGSGKTRLALQVAAEAADDFPDGVYWVPLQALRDADLVVPAVAQALAAQGDPAQHIGARRVLLVLDNFEQVVDAATGVAELLQRTPHLKVLCTSRESLRIDGEREYAVDPLPLDDAVRLFEERAAQREPIDAVRQICRQLDCLPLAVELAAARTKLLPPSELLARLEQALPVLTGGRRDAPERQRTLRAAIAWSHDLLAEDEQALFRALGVFAGSFDLKAAEEICGADLDGLQSLLDKSLLRRWENGRLGMLDTIREYALERLDESGEAEEIRERHARYYLEVANLGGLAADWEGPQRHDLVLPEAGNFRAAVDWCTERGQVELGLSLAVALENFWVTTDPHEGVRRFEALFAQAQDLPAALRARALRACASSTGPGAGTEDWEMRRRLLGESLDLYRALGDERGVAIILHRLGVLASWDDDPARARELAEESLAGHRSVGFVKGELQALSLLGYLEWEAGRKEHAFELKRESARLARQVGFRWWEAGELRELGMWALALGRPSESYALARESLAICRAIAYGAGSFWAVTVLSAAAAVDGRWGQAGRLWGAAEAEVERAPIPGWLGEQDEAAAYVLTEPGPGFEQARAAGRSLSFEAAIDEVLAVR